MITEEFNTF